ncbi:MAG: MmcQ/YjbR family DNA-binding protein [Deltaproteobacteria bacterium]|nr:MmcQ/YjbR family DNA-binding protein [Deltaproteobacteria bacterium]
MTYDDVRELARAFPGVEEGTSYGTAALKVKGKLIARLKEDGETLVLKTDLFEREVLLSAAPEVFFITDHYAAYPWVLVRLAKIKPEQLRGLLANAVRGLASAGTRTRRRRPAR